MKNLDRRTIFLISVQNIVAFSLGVFVNKVADQFHPSWIIIVPCVITLLALNIALSYILSISAQSVKAMPQSAIESGGAASTTEGPFTRPRFYAMCVFVFGGFTMCWFAVYVMLRRVHSPSFLLYWYWYLAALSCTWLSWALLKLYSSLTKKLLNRELIYGIPLITLVTLSGIGFWIMG